MLLRTVQVNTFKAAIDSVKDILGEVTMEFHPTKGLSMPAVDAGKRAFVYLNMPVENFEVFQLPGIISATFEISHLYKAVKNVTSHNYNCLSLIVLDNVMKVFIENTETSASVNYELRLIKDAQPELVLPELTYPLSFEIDARELCRYLREIQAVATQVKLRVKNNRVVLIASGALGKCKIVVPSGGKPTTPYRRSQIKGVFFRETVDQANISGTYNVRYLTAFCKAACLGSLMLVRVAHGKPLCCEFVVGGLGVLRYHLCAQ
jgi:proliferating cell nuclear antigen PCNA